MGGDTFFPFNENLAVIILICHLAAFPGLLLYFVLSLTLWRQKAGLIKTALTAMLIAAFNGVIIIPMLSMAGSIPDMHVATLLTALLFAITGFFTGALHYLFYKKWCDYRAKKAAS